MNNNDFKHLRPLLVVLGATGTGKSKLALELAIKYNGEVISADSMQIYKGLDIVTNKVTERERQLVPHHLIGFLDSLGEYTVVDFQRDSLRIIDKLHEAGKLPVIVGGTHYYIESILWNVLLGSHSDNQSGGSGDRSVSLNDEIDKNNLASDCEASEIVKKDVIGVKSEVVGDFVQNSYCDHDCYSKLSNEELYRKLEEVDPDYATTLHPNNRRKILRSLDVWKKTGRRHSEILDRMRQADGGDAFGSGKRFTNVVLLWLNCDQIVLKERLDTRVDEMISAGLLDELRDFHARFNAPLLPKHRECPLDPTPSQEDDAKEDLVGDHYQKGIFQSIGFKEFHDYLMLAPQERDTPRGEKLYKIALDLMKQRTFKYSKRQLKWIRNRFLIRKRKSFPVYSLDVTEPSKWSECVRKPAADVVESLLAQRIPSIPPVVIEVSSKTEIDTGNKSRHHCDICDRIFIGELQWKAHLQSAKHRNVLKRHKNDEDLESQQPPNKAKV